MSDVWLRLIVVAAALGVAVSIAYLLRRSSKPETRVIDQTGLPEGVYLFSSRTCPTCVSARDRLEGALGPGSFEELIWEDDPAVFTAIGVTEVPAVLRVGPGGEGSYFPGQPDEVLRDV
jgi:hypothetical protein